MAAGKQSYCKHKECRKPNPEPKRCGAMPNSKRLTGFHDMLQSLLARSMACFGNLRRRCCWRLSRQRRPRRSRFLIVRNQVPRARIDMVFEPYPELQSNYPNQWPSSQRKGYVGRCFGCLGGPGKPLTRSLDPLGKQAVDAEGPFEFPFPICGGTSPCPAWPQV